MTTTTTTSSADGVAARWGLVEKVVAVPAGVMLLGVGALGAWISFHNVRAAMEPSFGAQAWAVPVAVDLGIFLFTALDLLLTRLRLRPLGLRFVPWGLIACTIYLNIEPSLATGDTRGAVGHMVVPAIWVVAVEVTAGIVRRVAGLSESDADRQARTRPMRLGLSRWLDARRARGRIDRVRLSRWLLAPVSTALLWRRMVLWEIRSYSVALGRERDRLLARTDLQDTHGPIKWRWRASRRDRALYRLGELTPSSLGEPAPQTPAAPPPAAAPGAGSTSAPRTNGRNGARANGRAASSHKRSDNAPSTGRRRPRGDAEETQLLEDARAVKADFAAEGRPVTHKALGPALRERGWAVGGDRVSELLHHLNDTSSEESHT